MKQEYDYDHAWDHEPFRPSWRQMVLAAVVLLVVLLVGGIARATETWFSDSVANLGNAGVFTGVTRDTGAGVSQWNYFGCSVITDQAGTLAIEDSTDNVTFATAATAAIVASTRLDLNVRLRTRYIRCKETNGATPQTTNRLVSSFTTG